MPAELQSGTAPSGLFSLLTNPLNALETTETNSFLVANGTSITTQVASALEDGDSSYLLGAYSNSGGFQIATVSLVICFLAGTMIATPAGDVPIERLQPGDLVRTLSGASRRIVWVGQGQAQAARGRRDAATPVLVRKGALADNVPYADLRVTMAHGLYVDGVLIPAEFLVNHRSIIWDDHAQDVTLYHIELETHDILLANGAPAESYRDDGNRWLFQNANSGWGLPPQQPCAPVLTGGPIVDAVWRRLLDRAGPRPGLPLTDDPDLHLLVDGRRLNASGPRPGKVLSFRLPGRPRNVRIVSRAAAPSELGLTRDPRRLGVALRQVVLWRDARPTVLPAEDARLTTGFHGYEPREDLRWTTGDALLPPALFADSDGPSELFLHLAGATRYPLLAGDA